MIKASAILILTLMFTVGPCVQAFEPPNLTNMPEPADPPPEARYLDQLVALDPAEPETYFNLGEVVADEAHTPSQVALARKLFVLAFELSRSQPDSDRLGASICLALRDIERIEQKRRWLLAIAKMLDPRLALTDWSLSRTIATDINNIAYKAATAVGLARAGRGVQARLLLEDPQVQDMILQYEALLGASGQSGAFTRIKGYAKYWPCPQCGNERIVNRPGRDEPKHALCPTCGGDPGPRITSSELIAQLRFESVMLRGVQRSWAAQLVVDRGEPLQDPTPNDIALFYTIDATKTQYKNGTWVMPGESTPPETSTPTISPNDNHDPKGPNHDPKGPNHEPD